jgi:NAD+ diphosphatase
MPVRTWTFVPAVVPPSELSAGAAWWFPIRGAEVVIDESGDGPAILRAESLAARALTHERAHFLGLLDGEPVYAVDVGLEPALPAGIGVRALRAMHGELGEELFTLAGRAMQIVEWDRTHRFCGRCGTRMDDAENERAKRCPACGLLSFPRLSPAVITLVERGDEALLARHTRSTDGTYAMLAGFVEPGESLEEAVQREIREETGIAVDRITYFGSQPWPFPHSLMIGFFAQYAGGEIRVDGEEIADAQWFHATAMPKVPAKLSISRKLIDAYAAKHGVTIAQP